jgi:Asp-tRNA(Asn)/Glu-tRNA(Gln) amidotransferase A subunit family amidase
VPSGLDARGLPLSLQVLGRPFDEALVLRVARAFERATDWRVAPQFRAAEAGSAVGEGSAAGGASG